MNINQIRKRIVDRLCKPTSLAHFSQGRQQMGRLQPYSTPDELVRALHSQRSKRVCRDELIKVIICLCQTFPEQTVWMDLLFSIFFPALLRLRRIYGQNKCPEEMDARLWFAFTETIRYFGLDRDCVSKGIVLDVSRTFIRQQRSKSVPTVPLSRSILESLSDAWQNASKIQGGITLAQLFRRLDPIDQELVIAVQIEGKTIPEWVALHGDQPLGHAYVSPAATEEMHRTKKRRQRVMRRLRKSAKKI